MKLKNKKLALIISILIVIVIGGYLFLTKDKKHEEQYMKDMNTTKNEKTNIVVLGSEPEAITAAVTAARLGYKVDLITQDKKLGGLFTQGMLTALDLNYITGEKTILHEGFFTEFYDNASNGYNLDLVKTQKFFDEVTKHKNIKIVKEAKDITPIVDKNNPRKAVGVSYKKGNDTISVAADFIFDDSYEAEFTRKMGAMYRTGRSEFGQPDEYAAAGIMFSLKDVNWDELKHSIKKNKEHDTGVNGNAAWGFKQMYDYIPQNDIFKMRGLNISRQDDGSIVLNALLVLGVNPLDEKSYKHAIELSKDEIPHIVEYMKANLPGFENASLDKIAEDLYIREGVRIVGDKTLNGYDIIAHTKFDDVIGFGSYPSDLQTTHKKGYGNAQNGNSMYEVPLSSMLPKSIDNVIVLGRHASLDIVAHGSARTVPVLMSMSQGAVHAVDYALTNNLDIREVRDNHMDEVHKEMRENGKMKLVEMPENPYEGHWAEKYIKHLRIRGLLSSKYTGVINLDEQAKLDDARMVINLAIDHSTLTFTSQQMESLKYLNQDMTEADLVKFTSIILDKPLADLDAVKNEGVISEELYNKIKTSQVITNADMYGLLSEYINFMQPNFKEDIREDKIDVEISNV